MEEKTGFMCKIAFDHELGHKSKGNIVYPDIESLQHHHECVGDCGIVEVSVVLKKVISETDLSKVA